DRSSLFGPRSGNQPSAARPPSAQQQPEIDPVHHAVPVEVAGAGDAPVAQEEPQVGAVDHAVGRAEGRDVGGAGARVARGVGGVGPGGELVAVEGVVAVAVDAEAARHAGGHQGVGDLAARHGAREQCGRGDR
ncbi:MAG: hypothetical protein ACK55I_20010, partial [bacterium]